MGEERDLVWQRPFYQCMKILLCCSQACTCADCSLRVIHAGSLILTTHFVFPFLFPFEPLTLVLMWARLAVCQCLPKIQAFHAVMDIVHLLSPTLWPSQLHTFSGFGLCRRRFKSLSQAHDTPTHDTPVAEPEVSGVLSGSLQAKKRKYVRKDLEHLGTNTDLLQTIFDSRLFGRQLDILQTSMKPK